MQGGIYKRQNNTNFRNKMFNTEVNGVRLEFHRYAKQSYVELITEGDPPGPARITSTASQVSVPRAIRLEHDDKAWRRGKSPLLHVHDPATLGV